MTRRDEPIPALSAALSHLVMIGGLLLVAFPTLNGPRPSSPWFPDQPPAPHDAARHDNVPTPLTPAAPSPDVAAAPLKEEWTEDEIVRAKEQCTHVLSGSAVEVEWLEPIRKGDCGLPAPVRLKSLGSDPKVVFDPPVDVNCRMVAALGEWVKTTLQSEARERFKSPVVRIVGASGYACRNIYNLPNARLSQHALANAIDIGGFSLANGHTIAVLKGWGQTERDLKAQAKAEAKAAAQAKSNPAKKDELSKQDKPAQPGRDKPGSKVTQAALTPNSKSVTLDKKPETKDSPAAKAAEATKPDAQFLRVVHDGACHEFGTVLGPEANEPHRNHFHLDLIPRQGRGYCQ